MGVDITMVMLHVALAVGHVHGVDRIVVLMVVLVVITTIIIAQEEAVLIRLPIMIVHDVLNVLQILLVAVAMDVISFQLVKYTAVASSVMLMLILPLNVL